MSFFRGFCWFLLAGDRCLIPRILFLDFAPFLTLTCNCSSFSLNTRGYRELLLVFFGGFLRDFTCFKVVSLLHRIYFPGLLFSLGDALDLPSWRVLLCLPRWRMIRIRSSRWLRQRYPNLCNWVPRSGRRRFTTSSDTIYGVWLTRSASNSG